MTYDEEDMEQTLLCCNLHFILEKKSLKILAMINFPLINEMVQGRTD